MEMEQKSMAASTSFPGGGVGSGPQLDDQAKGQVDYAKTFGPMIAGGPKEETKLSGEDVKKRERAKRANKIYRQVCNQAGLETCFFNNFGSWSDYVGGKINEEEFREKTASVAQLMAQNEN
jgi:hypothetical protein